MQKNEILNSPKLIALRKKRKRILKRKIILSLIFSLILITAFAFFTRIPKLKITEIKVSGNKIVDTRDIIDLIQRDLNEKYFWVFQKRNFLIYPKYYIKKDLANNYKRLKNISISLESLNTLNVEVSEYDGKYLWCGTIIPIHRSDTRPESNKCYFLDENGYIFDEAPYFSGNVYFRFYGMVDNDDNPLGKFFLKEHFADLIKFKENISKMNLKPTSFFELGGENHTGEGFISLDGEPTLSPYVTFKIESDYQKLAENLQAAITTEPLQTELKNKFDSLLYIDLKFGNKVFYKFK